MLLLGLIPFTGFAAFLALYGPEIGIDDVGPVFALYAGLVLLIRIDAARLPDRLGWRIASTGALLSVGTGAALIGLWSSSVAVYISTVFMAMGMSLLFPALFSAVMNDTPETERSQAVGTFSLFFDLSQGLGAPILGLVVALSGSYQAAFLTSTLAALGGFAAMRALHLRAASLHLDDAETAHSNIRARHSFLAAGPLRGSALTGAAPPGGLRRVTQRAIEVAVLAGEVLLDLDVVEAGGLREGGDRGALGLADLDDQRTAGLQPHRRLRDDPLDRLEPRAAGDDRAGRLPIQHLGGSGSVPATYGGLATTSCTGPRRSSGSPSNQSPCTNRTRRAGHPPRPARLARATAIASAETSVATTSTSGSLGHEREGDRARAGAEVDGDRPARRGTRARGRRGPRSRAAGSAPARRASGRGSGTASGRARTGWARRRAGGRAARRSGPSPLRSPGRRGGGRGPGPPTPRPPRPASGPRAPASRALASASSSRQLVVTRRP